MLSETDSSRTATPASFAVSASRGRWRLARHLALLDDALLDAAGGGERVIITAPPRHGKSELVSRYFPAWYLGTYPTRRLVLAAHTADFAGTWGGRARGVLDAHSALFGVRVRDDTSARGRWETDREGGMIAVGVGGALTGRGADLLIVDDPIRSDVEANSPTTREAIWDWFRSVALTRLEPGASVIVTAARWSEDDLIGRLLASEGERWRVISLPALAEPGDLLGRIEGEPLWPERFDVAALEEIRGQVGSYYWAALYQGRPVPAGGAVFKREWFRSWRPAVDGYDLGDELVAAKQCRRFQTVDLAVSTATSADYTVIASWAVTPDRRLLLLDIDRRRLEAPDIVPALQAAYAKHRPAYIGIERVAFQLGIVQEARRAGLPVRELRPDSDKLSRALPAAARMEGGGVLWPERVAWRDVVEDEVLSFPRGRHDDIVDVLSYAIAEVTAGTGKPARVYDTSRVRLPSLQDVAAKLSLRRDLGIDSIASSEAPRRPTQGRGYVPGRLTAEEAAIVEAQPASYQIRGRRPAG